MACRGGVHTMGIGLSPVYIHPQALGELLAQAVSSSRGGLSYSVYRCLVATLRLSDISVGTIDVV